MYRSVFASLLLCMIFSGLFAADLQGYFNRASQPIAVLQDSGGTTRRLGLNQLTWDRAGRGTLFGSGDTIATGEGGQAKLVFYAGGEVTLDEGTMLVLGGSLEELQLNFVSGTGRVRVEKQAASKIKVAQAAPVVQSGRAPAAGTAPARPPISRVSIEQVDKLPPVAETNPADTPVAAAPERAAAPKIVTAIKESEISETAQVMSTGGEIASVAKLPPAPEVVFPSKDAVFDLTTGKVPKLEWKVAGGEAQDENLSFEIILRPAEGQSDEGDLPAVKVLRSSSPALSLSRVSHGKYLWSVRTVASDGTRSPATQARFMEVIVPAQIERPKVLPVKID